MEAMVKRRDIEKLSFFDMDEFRVYFHNNHENQHVIYTSEDDENDVETILDEYESGVRVSFDMIFLNIN